MPEKIIYQFLGNPEPWNRGEIDLQCYELRASHAHKVPLRRGVKPPEVSLQQIVEAVWHHPPSAWLFNEILASAVLGPRWDELRRLSDLAGAARADEPGRMSGRDWEQVLVEYGVTKNFSMHAEFVLRATAVDNPKN